MSRWDYDNLNNSDYYDFKDRLSAMFKALRSDYGFGFARQNYGCCQSCVSYEIGQRSDERVANGKDAITRYAFYTRQDAAEIPSGGTFIAFGHDVDAGQAVSDAAHNAGLAVSWDGTLAHRVFVVHPSRVDALIADKTRRIAALDAMTDPDTYDRDAADRMRAEVASLLTPVS